MVIGITLLNTCGYDATRIFGVLGEKNLEALAD